MNNRILKRSWRSNFTKKDLNGAWLGWGHTFVSFDGLEDKTIVRLLEIGYAPPISITDNDNYYYRGGLYFSGLETPVYPPKRPGPYYKHDYNQFPAIVTC